MNAFKSVHQEDHLVLADLNCLPNRWKYLLALLSLRAIFYRSDYANNQLGIRLFFRKVVSRDVFAFGAKFYVRDEVFAAVDRLYQSIDSMGFPLHLKVLQKFRIRRRNRLLLEHMILPLNLAEILEFLLTWL